MWFMKTYMSLVMDIGTQNKDSETWFFLLERAINFNLSNLTKISDITLLYMREHVLYEMLNFCKNYLFLDTSSVYSTLLPISEFVLDENSQQNASKFARFYIYENPKLLFPFFISCYYFIFSPNECPGLCRYRPGHSLGKNLK